LIEPASEFSTGRQAWLHVAADGRVEGLLEGGVPDASASGANWSAACSENAPVTPW
jgi:hypothetical protein